MRFLTAVIAALLLAGCSPEYDWREIRSVEHGWSAMLPGKPASLTRRIHLEALEVPMTMQGARIQETAFTVASVDLPEDAQPTRAAALAAMRNGMLRNIGATESRVTPIQVTVLEPGGQPTGKLAAERVEATGTVQGRPSTLVAGFAADGRRAWQWVMLGPTVDREQAQTFLEGFRVVRPLP